MAATAHPPPPLQLPDGQVLGSSPDACDGASVIDVIGPPGGELRMEHTVLCLQRWLSPLTVRPLDAPGPWQVLRPQVRLWQPGEPQHFEWRGRVHQHFVLVTPARVERILERPYARSGIARWAGQDFDEPLVNHLVTAMAQDCADRSPAGPLVVDALVTALIHRLAAAAPPAAADGRLAPARLRRVLDFIEAELHRPLSLDELATEADTGLRRFCAAFRAAVGTSPHQHLLQRRTERAKHLLTGSAQPLAEIATAVGFADQSQFTRTFSRLVGVPPGRYRSRGVGA
jgi:AraC-like DNA-binding protein